MRDAVRSGPTEGLLPDRQDPGLRRAGAAEPRRRLRCIDDEFAAVYNDEASPSVVGEAEGLIEAMNVDEQRELIALSLVGRGEYAKDDWASALRAAGSHPEPTTSAFLLADPLVSDALEEGLSIFGFSCDEATAER